MSTKTPFLVLVLLPRLLFGAETLVLEGVHLVPMDREVVLEDMTVVVEDGRIAALGKRGRIDAPRGARSVEAEGRYLLPGLYEMHAHVREREALGLYLAHGFTTVRDMNGRLGDTLGWRREVEEGTLAGPRIVAAGVTLHAGAPEDFPYHVEAPEQARSAVRDMEAEGYDLIKVYRVAREPFFALMEEAKALGIPVAGHHPDVVHDQSYQEPLDLTTDEVIASGMVSLEHLDELINASLRMKLDRERVRPLAESLRAKGVAVATILGQDFLVQAIHREGQAFVTEARERDVRTLFGDEGVTQMRKQIDFIVNELPPSIEALGAAIPDFSLFMLRTFNEAGVDLLIGTDSHNGLLPAGSSGLDEMDLFVRAGLTPYDALRAATYNGAKVLNELDRRGTIAVGKQADLLLVGGNPLESLEFLRRPVGVMIGGRYLDDKELEALKRPN